MTCTYCRPHADARKQRLCHVGIELFNDYKRAAELYSEFAMLPDPPIVATEDAKKIRDEARRAFRAHTDGD